MTRPKTGRGWDIDLRHGEIREDAFANMLFRRHVRIEHKSDDKCVETGNVFLEYEQHGELSGISITEAYYWATEFEPECWIILPVERVKAIGRKKCYERKNGGDNGNRAVIIPLRDLLLNPWTEEK